MANGKWQAADERQRVVNSKWRVAEKYMFSGGQRMAK